MDAATSRSASIPVPVPVPVPKPDPSLSSASLGSGSTGLFGPAFPEALTLHILSFLDGASLARVGTTSSEMYRLSVYPQLYLDLLSQDAVDPPMKWTRTLGDEVLQHGYPLPRPPIRKHTKADKLLNLFECLSTGIVKLQRSLHELQNAGTEDAFPYILQIENILIRVQQTLERVTEAFHPSRVHSGQWLENNPSRIQELMSESANLHVEVSDFVPPSVRVVPNHAVGGVQVIIEPPTALDENATAFVNVSKVVTTQIENELTDLQLDAATERERDQLLYQLFSPPSIPDLEETRMILSKQEAFRKRVRDRFQAVLSAGSCTHGSGDVRPIHLMEENDALYVCNHPCPRCVWLMTEIAKRTGSGSMSTLSWECTRFRLDRVFESLGKLSSDTSDSTVALTTLQEALNTLKLSCMSMNYMGWLLNRSVTVIYCIVRSIQSLPSNLCAPVSRLLKAIVENASIAAPPFAPVSFPPLSDDGVHQLFVDCKRVLRDIEWILSVDQQSQAYIRMYEEHLSKWDPVGYTQFISGTTVSTSSSLDASDTPTDNTNSAPSATTASITITTTDTTTLTMTNPPSTDASEQTQTHPTQLHHILKEATGWKTRLRATFESWSK